MDPILHFLFAVACCGAVFACIQWHRENVKRQIVERAYDNLAEKLEKLEELHGKAEAVFQRQQRDLVNANMIIHQLQTALAKHQTSAGIAGIMICGSPAGDQPQAPTGLN